MLLRTVGSSQNPLTVLDDDEATWPLTSPRRDRCLALAARFYPCYTRKMDVELDHLSPEDRDAVCELAKASGKTLPEVLASLVHKALAGENGGKREGNGSASEETAGGSCYEAAVKSGVIGAVDDLPTGYRTDARTWDEFGRG